MMGELLQLFIQQTICWLYQYLTPHNAQKLVRKRFDSEICSMYLFYILKKLCFVWKNIFKKHWIFCLQDSQKLALFLADFRSTVHGSVSNWYSSSSMLFFLYMIPLDYLINPTFVIFLYIHSNTISTKYYRFSIC